MEKKNCMTWNRREFIKGSVVGLAGLSAFSNASVKKEEKGKKAKIVLFKTDKRREGVREIFKHIDLPQVKGKDVLIKPNFNTADPAPGSTHNDTLSQLILELREKGASGMTVGERSGPPPTQRIMEEKGIFDLGRELNFEIINFEDLAEKEWVHVNPTGNHWKEGFYIPRPVTEADYVVSTCCLKTHQYGGVFTLSLKLAVGLTPKTLMGELHRSPNMRRMIAEINLGYKPHLIVLDGIEAFVDGGPMTGTRKAANVFLAGTDRVAVDAVGIAVLKQLGSNEAIMSRKIFEQEQIQRAVELGLGISSPEEIELITPDKKSREYAEKIRSILVQG